MKVLRSLAMAAALVGFGAVAHADGSDSSSDAGQAIAAQISNSQGVIVRVPVNAQGQEDSRAAELRVQLGDAPLSSAQDSVTAWNSALSTSSMPVVGGDVNSDTSTHGNDGYEGNGYGWQNYRGNGYVDSYYYNNYSPSYYYGGGYSYNYGRPSYYDYNYNYGGYYNCYRYYYYPRYWR